MLLYSCLYILVLLPFCLLSSGKRKIQLKIAFFILFLCSAIRFDNVADYITYYLYFMKLEPFSWSSIKEVHAQTNYEYAFLVLESLFRYWGTNGFYLFIVFQSWVILLSAYKLIEFFCPPCTYWIAVSIYFWNPNLYFMQMGVLRQAFAIALVVFAIIAIYQQHTIKYMVSSVIAVFFHFTAVVFLPFYFFAKNVFPKLNKKLILFSIFVVLYLANFYVKDVCSFFVGKFLPEYAYYLAMPAKNNILGNIAYMLLLAFIIFMLKLKTQKVKFIYHLCLLYFLLRFVTFGTNLMRLSYYFNIFEALAIAQTVVCLSAKRLIRTAFLLALHLFLFARFFSFYQADGFQKLDRIKTIFTEDINSLEYQGNID